MRLAIPDIPSLVSLVAASALAMNAHAATTEARPSAAKPSPPAHAAQPVRAGGPHAIGRFDDWVAATNLEAGALTCYAFTRVQASEPKLSGRGDVVLTVTERTTPRDAVAISAGFSYAATASVAVVADGGNFDFYTAGRSAFARDGRAVVAAFHKGARVVTKSPGPKGAVVTDAFSLRGFSAAYAAILKACPIK